MQATVTEKRDLVSQRVLLPGRVPGTLLAQPALAF
jgi:hypothetical protein